ncbi:LPS export ABC transporter permease LptG [Thiocapsa imhoffii]|uniref:LPS export ABC transporter permease LptG n=1 Tax=Thiocapsa imhoffii TaxID=382777 RepID=A0A9X0WEV5_9GAMM|nr:LPS export ABC transporter permease LptG [Thiocapsa imhoffii]MBK1643288.1 LPS export ABC transporter permease LptG [Thiocapsa imhoffii]
MRILDRYLASAVLGGTLLTLGVLLPLLGFFILAEEVDALGVDGYGFMEAMLFMGLSLPRYAYQIFPIATLIGALIGLGALASRSELVAMRAAGVSVWGIIRASLLGGLVLAAVAVVIGEVIAPKAEQRALELRRQALSGDVSQQTPYGFWAIDDRAFVNIREIESPTRLSDIFIYQVDAATGSLVATHAAGARYQDEGWVLETIARSRVSAQGVTVEHMEQAQWDSLIDPGILKVIVLEPHLLPVWGLYKYIRFMRLNKQDAGNYEIAFWGKVFHPVLTLSMIFVAIPILLGSARTTGFGQRIFIGVLVGILYYLVSRTFAFFALLFELAPLAATLLPPALFLSAALLLLRRVG